MLDADLQDPPELILDDARALAGRLRRRLRGPRAARRRVALQARDRALVLQAVPLLAQVELEPNSGDFRLLDRRALDALLSMRERNRFLRGMTVWVGFTQAAVPYDRDARYAGETKYTLAKMLRFSLDAIASFSHRPLQLATLLGFMISTVAFIAIPVVIVLQSSGSYLPGFGTVTITILLLGGIQLIAIGIIGEYVGRIYDEVKGRPLYLVRARRNFGAMPGAVPPVRLVTATELAPPTVDDRRRAASRRRGWARSSGWRGRRARPRAGVARAPGPTSGLRRPAPDVPCADRPRLPRAPRSAAPAP